MIDIIFLSYWTQVDPRKTQVFLDQISLNRSSTLWSIKYYTYHRIFLNLIFQIDNNAIWNSRIGLIDLSVILNYCTFFIELNQNAINLIKLHL